MRSNNRTKCGTGSIRANGVNRDSQHVGPDGQPSIRWDKGERHNFGVCRTKEESTSFEFETDTSSSSASI